MPDSQDGMVLLVSLVFLLLLTLLGISSMQNATLQEKMAGSVMARNTTFQIAEGALRLGESWVQVSGSGLAPCATVATCAPPSESTTVLGAGRNDASNVTWTVAGKGFFGVQNLGTTASPISRPATCSSTSTVTLYRVTAIAFQGTSRTVVESVYAKC